MQILGIDVGGSGIKGALVDINTGLLATERYRLVTPDPSVPEAVGDVVAEIVKHFDWHGPIGCTFPSVVRDGIIYTAAKLAPSWRQPNCSTRPASSAQLLRPAFWCECSATFPPAPL